MCLSRFGLMTCITVFSGTGKSNFDLMTTLGPVAEHALNGAVSRESAQHESIEGLEYLIR